MNAVTNKGGLLAVLFTTIAAVPVLAQDPPKPAPAPAPAPKQDPRAELKQRIQARHPSLEKLRDDGKVGETAGGEIKLVKASYGSEKVDPNDASKGTVAELVAAENKDRQAVYELVAKQEKTTAAEVAKQNGLKNIDRAKPDHWVEVKGQWVQRKAVRAEENKNTEGTDKK